MFTPFLECKWTQMLSSSICNTYKHWTAFKWIQVPRTEGNEKGKGNYWSFASGCESMLDLFENGNYRRRRRRRNMKREHKEQRPSGGKDPSSPESSSMDSGLYSISCHESKCEPAESGPKLLEPPGFFPNNTSNRQSLNNASLGKSDSEIKFSIDYILSAPDPLPVLRSQYHMQDNKYQLLESQKINLPFWTMWYYSYLVTNSVIQSIQQPGITEYHQLAIFFHSSTQKEWRVTWSASWDAIYTTRT